MELFKKLEDLVADKIKLAPSLPASARKQIADNLWWVVLVLAVACAVGAIGAVNVVFSNMAILSNPFMSYSVSVASVTSQTIQAATNLVFLVILCALLGSAIVPLKDGRQVGWRLLFAALIIGAVSVAVSAVSTLSVFGFITTVIFGALWLVICAYLVFEVRSSFIQVEKSKGLKGRDKKR